MKHIFTFFSFLFALSITAQDFYDLNTIQTIEITFAESNWDALLDAQKNGAEDYIMAQSVIINGTSFDSVGVKYKGNSTYNANQKKNPFHIELDTYKEHDYQGYKDIKLSNVAKDPSFLREVLSYNILGKYMDAPLSNYANVYVNGALIGLYSNSESISKKFVNDKFLSKKNTFIKCNPPDGAGPGTSSYPNLVYLGQDSSSYYNAYELKSDAGWNELINLCDTLANHSDNIESILDIDRSLWMLAFNNALVNLDSYIGAFSQNYYLYRDDYGRFLPIVWDLNESFGGFTSTGSANLNSNTQKQQMSHLLHLNDSDFPLIQKLLSVPLYKRMYNAHLKTIMLENFDNDSYFETGMSLQTVIKDAVQADNNKFYTYNNFLDNLTKDVSGGGGGPGGGNSTIGITNLMDSRNTYLLGLADFNQTEPTIENVAADNDSPFVNDELFITADITNNTVAYLGYRSAVGAPFTRVLMYDDGAHNDGAAGDGKFGGSLTVEGSFIQYYIYAENDNLGFFSPRRAEHEYYTINATITTPTVGDLVINELMASNSNTQSDLAGDYDDWIELYNNGTSTIDLSGYFLSDDIEDLTQYKLPSGTEIAENGYLIIWADSDEDPLELHANFKLSASSETLYLSDPSGAILDQVSFSDQNEDISYGRFPNGTGNFQTMEPTFNGENTGLTSIFDPLENNLLVKVYPNPISQFFILERESQSNLKSSVKIVSATGSLIYTDILTQKLEINTSAWPIGIYIVKVDGVSVKLVKN